MKQSLNYKTINCAKFHYILTFLLKVGLFEIRHRIIVANFR